MSQTMEILIPTVIVIWVCVGLFVATAIITILALIGKMILGPPDRSKHGSYLWILFSALMLEVTSVCVGVFRRNMLESQVTDWSKTPYSVTLTPGNGHVPGSRTDALRCFAPTGGGDPAYATLVDVDPHSNKLPGGLYRLTAEPVILENQKGVVITAWFDAKDIASFSGLKVMINLFQFDRKARIGPEVPEPIDTFHP